jgi:SM-20-related protein
MSETSAMPEVPEAGDALRRIVEGIAASGWTICEHFLPDSEVCALAAEATAALRAGAFAPAGVGKRAARREDERGDHILWIDAAAASAVTRRLLGRFEEIRLALNRELTLGLFDFEGHFASYPPGGAYRRHRDRFRADPARVLSTVLYLNRGWRREDGGALRLYHGEEHSDVLPEGGTFVAFLSARFEHEVLATGRERSSFTGWFLRRP